MPVGNLVTEIASVIHQNARDGVVDWQTVTEWALEDDHTAMIGHAAFECTDAAITMEGNNG